MAEENKDKGNDEDKGKKASDKAGDKSGKDGDGDKDRTYSNKEMQAAIARRQSALDKARTAEDELGKMKAAQEKAEKDAAKKRGEFEKLYEAANVELTTAKKRIEEFEKAEKKSTDALTKLVEKEIDGIPEERRSLVPTQLSVQDQFNYITANREFLVGKGKKSVGGPSKPGDRETPSEGDKKIGEVSKIVADEKLSLGERVDNVLGTVFGTKKEE